LLKNKGSRPHVKATCYATLLDSSAMFESCQWLFWRFDVGGLDVCADGTGFVLPTTVEVIYGTV
jgi:hypothetical protein